MAVSEGHTAARGRVGRESLIEHCVVSAVGGNEHRTGCASRFHDTQFIFFLWVVEALPA